MDETAMAQPDECYMCFRPDTKSKKKYARCQQYIFETPEQLHKWLCARKNSTERVTIHMPVCNTRPPQIIEAKRKDLVKLTESWLQK